MPDFYGTARTGRGAIGRWMHFDVSTDAHPNQIRKLFRNCFLIGRRFRLAHIRFGETIILAWTEPGEPSRIRTAVVSMSS